MMTTDDARILRAGLSRHACRTVVMVVVGVLASACASGGRSALDEGSRGGHSRLEGDGTVFSFDLTTDRTAIRRTIAVEPAAAWAALPAVYEALGLKGAGVIDAKHRIYGIPDRVMAPPSLVGQPLARFFKCGSTTAASSADTYEVRFLALTQIDSTATDGTAVLTRVDAVARSRGVSGLAVNCSTTGRLEQLLTDSLQARIGRTEAP